MVSAELTPLHKLPGRMGKPPLWDTEALNRIEVLLEQYGALAGSTHRSYWTAYARARKLRTLLAERDITVIHRVWQTASGKHQWGITLIKPIEEEDQ